SALRHIFTRPEDEQYPGWLALDRRATAICGDDRTGDVACTWRCEKSDDFGDLLSTRGAVEQCGGPEHFGALRCRATGVHRAGGDGVHPYAAGAELRSPGTRQRREGTLCRPVGRTTRESDLASHAADV